MEHDGALGGDTCSTRNVVVLTVKMEAKFVLVVLGWQERIKLDVPTVTVKVHKNHIAVNKYVENRHRNPRSSMDLEQWSSKPKAESSSLSEDAERKENYASCI